MNLNFGWSSPQDDAVVNAVTLRFLSRSVSLAKSLDLYHPFIYMNYASLDQDVYAGYGSASLERLAQIRDMYDPEDVFGKLWRGYFKI